MKNLKLILLFLSWLSFCSTFALIFADKIAKLLIKPSVGATSPDSSMIGLKGLITVAAPWVLFFLCLALFLSYLSYLVIDQRKIEVLIVSLFVISILNYYLIAPYKSEISAQRNAYEHLQQNKADNYPHSFGLETKYKFSDEYWFLKKILLDEKIAEVLNETFADGVIRIEYKSGMSVIPFSAFKKYSTPGKSLYDVLNGEFDLSLSVENKNLIFKTPQDKTKPYLKILNIAFIGQDHLGVNLRVENTKKSLIFFVSAKKIKNNKLLGSNLKKFKNIQTIILIK